MWKSLEADAQALVKRSKEGAASEVQQAQEQTHRAKEEASNLSRMASEDRQKIEQVEKRSKTLQDTITKLEKLNGDFVDCWRYHTVTVRKAFVKKINPDVIVDDVGKFTAWICEKVTTFRAAYETLQDEKEALGQEKGELEAVQQSLIEKSENLMKENGLLEGEKRALEGEKASMTQEKEELTKAQAQGKIDLAEAQSFADKCLDEYEKIVKQEEDMASESAPSLASLGYEELIEAYEAELAHLRARLRHT